MKAEQLSFLEFLGMPATQFLVPAFQRVYSWTYRECKDLWESIEEAGKNKKEQFIGTLLYSDLGFSDDHIRCYQIVDGQQRLTTLTLSLIAFSRHCANDNRSVECVENGISHYLFTETDERREPKLLLTPFDAETLEYLLGLADKPEDIASRLVDNLAFFEKEMGRPSFSPQNFMEGLHLLSVIAIRADSDDEPQEIFESLNSKGKRLAIEDLVRNSLLLTTPENADPVSLYEQEWLPLEKSIEDAQELDMEDLLCSWIASNHDRVFIDSKSEVYPLFKADLSLRFGGDYRSLLRTLNAYAKRMIAHEQFRRDELTNMERWLQGKPKHLISERKRFGD